MPPLFSQLNLVAWRQFHEIDVSFDKQLTILTGANGAGKSTILQILKSHFAQEHDEKFLATPIQSSGSTDFSLGDWIRSSWRAFLPKIEAHLPNKVGSISFSDGQLCELALPPGGKGMEYALTRNIAVEVPGLSISSHRSLPRYEAVQSISVSGILPAEAYADFFNVQRSYVEQQSYVRHGVHRRVNPVAALKEALISFANFGTGNVHVSPVPELYGLYENFQDILARVLPQEVGFIKLEIRTPEVVIVSSSGDFPIDGASGGLMSIIQIAWQIFLQAHAFRGESFSVLIDEPENHLHPSMQRSFLSNLIGAFPMAQFIVATHSPFIVSSVRDATVYALRHHSFDADVLRPLEPRSVDSERLDQVTRAGPANDILREVLGVPVTLPEWSAHELEEISAEFAAKELNAETLSALRSRLRAAGLAEFYPQAVSRLLS